MDDYVSLGDVVRIQRGTTYKSALIGQPGPVLLGLGSIKRHGGFRGDNLRTYGGDSPEELIVQPGQIYASLKDVTQTADVLGAVAKVPVDGVPGRLTQDTVRLDFLDSRISADYLYWMLRTPEYRTYCRNHATGTTTMGLSREAFFSFRIPAPTPNRIALTTLLGALDDKITANEEIIRLSMELAHSIVLDVMRTAQLDESHIAHTKFGELGTLFDGPHATPTRLAEGPYFLNISSLKFGRLDLAESDHVSENDFAQWVRRVRPEEGDLLFSYETRLGEAALMPGGIRACLGRRMALLRPDRTRVDPTFLLHFYLSPQFQGIIGANTIHGATVPRIGLATMPNWEIAIPTVECQRTVSPALDALQSRMVQSGRESDQLAKVRDEFLHLLMAGRVRLKEAELIVGI